VVVRPAGNQGVPCILALFDGDDAAVMVVGIEGIGGFAGSSPAWRCVASRFVGPHFGQVRDAVGGGDAAEGGAGFDGLELFGIADEGNLGVRFFGSGERTLQLPRAGLVDDQDIALVERIASAFPGEFVARESAGLNAGGSLEVFDSGAGDAGQGFQIALPGHFFHGPLLCGTQRPFGEYGGASAGIHGVLGAVRQFIGRPPCPS
jgi:hypothetical protein